MLARSKSYHAIPNRPKPSFPYPSFPLRQHRTGQRKSRLITRLLFSQQNKVYFKQINKISCLITYCSMQSCGSGMLKKCGHKGTQSSSSWQAKQIEFCQERPVNLGHLLFILCLSKFPLSPPHLGSSPPITPSFIHHRPRKPSAKKIKKLINLPAEVMPANKQYKPTRTRGLGFVPPTLRLQHQVRLPFIRDSCDNKNTLPSRETSAVGVAEEEAADSQEGSKNQAMTDADSQEVEEVEMVAD